jgi:hypothetical protein
MAGAAVNGKSQGPGPSLVEAGVVSPHRRSHVAGKSQEGSIVVDLYILFYFVYIYEIVIYFYS